MDSASKAELEILAVVKEFLDKPYSILEASKHGDDVSIVVGRKVKISLKSK